MEAALAGRSHAGRGGLRPRPAGRPGRPAHDRGHGGRAARRHGGVAAAVRLVGRAVWRRLEGTRMRIGFIGLGAMGLPMAGHLVAAGHEVTVASRSRGPDRRRSGPGSCGRRLAARRGRGVGGDHAVRPQLARRWWRWSTPCCRSSGRARRWSTAPPSTPRWSGPSTSGSLRRGARYLDAPLSGGTAGAHKGALTLMVGGDAGVLAGTEPGPRAASRAHRARRGPGHGPGGQAVQPADLRRADDGDGRGHGHGRQVRRRHGQALRGAHPRHRATAWPCGPACPCPAWSPRARRRTAGSRDS